MYLLNGADEAQMSRMRDYLTELCTGWDVEQVRQIVAETLHELIDPIIYDEAAALIEEHRAAGRDVMLVSCWGEEVVSAIGELLGVDRVIATRMVVEHGRYTGEIEYYADGPNKATAIKELAESEGYDLDECFAYSDSSPMCRCSSAWPPLRGQPRSGLRRLAVERGWPVVTFRRPVAARRRFSYLSHPSTPIIAATAIGISPVTVAGLLWYGRYKRTRAVA